MPTPDNDLPDLAASLEEFTASNYSPSGIVTVARREEILNSHRNVAGDEGGRRHYLRDGARGASEYSG